MDTGSLYEGGLPTLISGACRHLRAELSAEMPHLASRLFAWLEAEFATADLAEPFQRQAAYPMLLFPWWAQKAIAGAPDHTLQTQLVRSTLCGYWHIRLLDSVVDGHDGAPRDLLPACNVLLCAFLEPYRQLFPACHPFWAVFRAVWYRATEATFLDARLTDVDAEAFTRLSSQKTGAAKIPVAAVLWAGDRPRDYEKWQRFMDLYGRWHQLHDDLMDWAADLRGGVSTYILSEARRRKRCGQPLAEWMLREGWAWGLGELRARLAELHREAAGLGVPDVTTYLEAREAGLPHAGGAIQAGLDNLADLAARVLPGHPGAGA